jgi:GDP-fucose protein O-fucosyltransferase
LRYVDEIQCAAAKIVHAVRQKAKQNGDPDGIFDTFHIRRGDFQYRQTRIEATEIYDNVKDVLVENSTIFIATDERDKKFFQPLRQHYKVYFLDDFLHLVPDLNRNFYGMLDQRIASRGRTFIGGTL